MSRSRHLMVMAIVCAIVLAGIALGWFAVFDAGMRDLRFSATARPASGEIVFVDIDAAAMAEVGSAAQARSLYAGAIDRLVADGARTIVLDVPLHEALTYADDNALEFALEGAAHTARTAATQTHSGRGEIVLELPLARFAAVAPPVFIDAVPDEAPDIYRTRIAEQGWVIESLATALSPGRPVVRSSFFIDFSIDLDTIPRTTLSALIAGNVDPGLIAGRQVVIGYANALPASTQDVPRYGSLSTPSLQLLAAETVRQDRMLTEMGPLPVMLIVCGVGLLFAFFRPRMTFGAAIVGSLAYGGILEFTALGLQVHSGLLLDTAGIHVAQVGILAAAFWHELEARGRSLSRTARERDSMRGILTRVVADNFDGVVVVDHTRTIRAASRLAEDLIAPDLSGADFEAVLPAPFRAALTRAVEEGHATDGVCEATISCKGEDRLVEFVVTASEGDIGHVACLTFRDVTDRRRVEERLTYLAQHDPLTGAASRVKFIEAVGTLLATPAGRFRGASVFLVALSRLKTVNDTLGHAYGDALLKQVVARLELLGPVSVARLEGNAFAILREGLLGPEAGKAYAERLIAEIARPYTLKGHHAIVGARVGMTDSDLSGSAPDALVSHAGLALSIASDQTGNGVVAFRKDMEARIKGKQEMETALRAALARGEFSVHYQPQVDLESGDIVGVEALARWTHPDLGNVSPAEFIPAAEETGLIIELGRWVLHEACREVAGWPKPVRLSVNVSPLQFEYGDVVADVRSALVQSGLAPERLGVEITENLLLSETSHVIDKLKTLRAYGVGVALDDFGTGYSSLSYLGRLPVDTIKIDQSFVRGLPADTEASAIVRAVLMLSDSLGKNVIAEGVETADQAWLLRLAGCRMGQGYFFSRPGPAEDILSKLLDDHHDRLLSVRG